MSAGYLEIFVEQGEDFSANISLTSLNNSTYNLSKYSAKSDIRKSYWSANTSASFNAVVIDNGDSGELQISLGSSVTQNLTSSKYVYDIFLTDSESNNRTKILQGIIFVDPSSTKL